MKYAIRIALSVALVLISVAVFILAYTYTASYVVSLVAAGMAFFASGSLNLLVASKVHGWPRHPLLGALDFWPWG